MHKKHAKVTVVLKKDLIAFCGGGGGGRYDIWFESCWFQTTVELPLTNLQLSSILIGKLAIALFS